MTLVPIAQVSFYTHEGPGTGGNTTNNIYVTYVNENGQTVTIDKSSGTIVDYGPIVRFHAHPTGDPIDPWEDDILEYQVRYSPLLQNLLGEGFSGSVHIGNNTPDAVLEYDLNLLTGEGTSISSNGLNGTPSGDLTGNLPYAPDSSKLPTPDWFGGLLGGLSSFENWFDNQFMNYYITRNQMLSNDGAFGWLTPENMYLGSQYYGEKIGGWIGGLFGDSGAYWGSKIGRGIGDIIGLIGGGTVGLIEGFGGSIGYAAATGNWLAPIDEVIIQAVGIGEVIVNTPGMLYMIGDKSIKSIITGKNQFTDKDINKIIDWGATIGSIAIPTIGGKFVGGKVFPKVADWWRTRNLPELPASEYAHPETLTNKKWIEDNKPVFPAAKSFEELQKAFEDANYRVVHFTNYKFDKVTTIADSRKGAVALEDSGLYVAPKGYGNPYFAFKNYPYEYKFTLNPLKGLGIDTTPLKSPRVYETQVKGIVTPPREVLMEPGFRAVDEWGQKNLVGTGYIRYTKRSMIGQGVIPGQKMKVWKIGKTAVPEGTPGAKLKEEWEKGTREYEAIIDIGYKFIDKGPIGYFKHKGRRVIVHEVELVTNEGETVGKIRTVGNFKNVENTPIDYYTFKNMVEEGYYSLYGPRVRYKSPYLEMGIASVGSSSLNDIENRIENIIESYRRNNSDNNSSYNTTNDDLNYSPYKNTDNYFRDTYRDINKSLRDIVDSSSSINIRYYGGGNSKGSGSSGGSSGGGNSGGSSSGGSSSGGGGSGGGNYTYTPPTPPYTPPTLPYIIPPTPTYYPPTPPKIPDIQLTKKDKKKKKKEFELPKLPIDIKQPEVKKNKRTWFLRDLLNPNKAFKDMEETVVKSIKSINLNIKV